MLKNILIGIMTSLIAAFGGFYTSTKTLPLSLYWAKYLDWFGYGYEIVNVFTWSHVGEISC